MLPASELQVLAKAAESQYLERKQSLPKRGELRETLSAFSNSTPEGQFAVLFIGIRNDGEICGVSPELLDDNQRTIIAVSREDCYPPINAIPQVFEIEGKSVIAIIIEHSKKRPHFTGHAYKRAGPTSRKATEEEYAEFVAQRNDKSRRILAAKNNPISIHRPGGGLSTFHVLGGATDLPAPFNFRDFRIIECDAWILKVRDLLTDDLIAYSLEDVKIGWDMEKNRFKLTVPD